MSILQRVTVANNSVSGKDIKAGDGVVNVYLPGGSTGGNVITLDLPYESADAIIAVIRALSSSGAIVVTKTTVIDDGTPDATKNLSISGPPSVNGLANVVTDGSNTTVTTTDDAFANIVPGAAITANSGTRYVQSKSDNNTVVVDVAVDWDNTDEGYSFTYKNPLLLADDNGTVRAWVQTNGVVKVITSTGTIALAPAAHIADAVAAHTITAPADTPVDADTLRDDLNTNVLPSIKGHLDALGGKINAILARLEAVGLNLAA
jgi:hypothetical protein